MSRTFTGVDVETTGLLTPDHRIIEVFLGDWNAKGELLRSQTWRINPGRSIDAKAQAVHKITPADLIGCPDWFSVANEIREWMAHADVLVGHNAKEFDLPFLNQEFERADYGRVETPVIDTMLQGRWATPTGAVPNLGALCFACDVPYDTTKAHAASYDVEVMMACFFKAVAWGWIKVPDEIEVAVAA